MTDESDVQEQSTDMTADEIAKAQKQLRVGATIGRVLLYSASAYVLLPLVKYGTLDDIKIVAVIGLLSLSRSGQYVSAVAITALLAMAVLPPEGLAKIVAILN